MSDDECGLTEEDLKLIDHLPENLREEVAKLNNSDKRPRRAAGQRAEQVLELYRKRGQLLDTQTVKKMMADRATKKRKHEEDFNEKLKTNKRLKPDELVALEKRTFKRYTRIICMLAADERKFNLYEKDSEHVEDVLYEWNRIWKTESEAILKECNRVGKLVPSCKVMIAIERDSELPIVFKDIDGDIPGKKKKARICAASGVPIEKDDQVTTITIGKNKKKPTFVIKRQFAQSMRDFTTYLKLCDALHEAATEKISTEYAKTNLSYREIANALINDRKWISTQWMVFKRSREVLRQTIASLKLVSIDSSTSSAQHIESSEDGDNE